MVSRDRYPIGQQDFRDLREGGAYYVDKTEFIHKIVTSQSKFYFLARPRRFGKSLFLSTLRYFFEGRRELFKGLYIHSTDWKWEEYPVLRLDLNTDRYAENGQLSVVLDRLLDDWERKFGISNTYSDPSQRLGKIIESAHEKTGRKVVILVDEYDKPLVGNMNKVENFEQYRSQLASLYSNFKSSAEHIRLVFLTGVSRFSRLSVFSDLNNIKDISFSNDFADICGITEDELFFYFKEGIEELAQEYRVSYETICRRLKKNYDGYRFAKDGSDIYNPWSILNALSELRIGNYWNATGSASIIAEVLRDKNVDIEMTINGRWSLDSLAGLDLMNADPTALLYQTGYLTIADYDYRNDTVRLKVPNDEVKEGLFKNLLNFYINVKRGTPSGIVRQILDNINAGMPELMMKNLEAYFAGIPYDLKMDNENNFQNAIYILLTLIGIDVKTEVHTSDGRMDILIETTDYIYIMELKYDGSPDEALRQIDRKQYALKFNADIRKLFKIGVNFSSVPRRIISWKIEER
ncbi:MAG: ATP-binding protein [Muribaculaceae bacterium]|nr:ATP-binding protein [Muribaculaceae bacterium]